MCDACKTISGVLRMLRLEPDDKRDPIALAQKRLRCYYECVTADMTPELLDDDDDDEDDWMPEY